MKNIFFLLIVTSMILTSCKKDDPETNNSASTASFVVELNHFWESDTLHLDSTYIHPTTQDTFQFTTFKYYISNVRLKTDAGNWVSIPESYYLINLNEGSKISLTIPSVPKNNYTELELLFGVDSTRNTSGAQTGVLSATNGMFWSWNTGYIMLKAEGLSPNSVTNSFAFHLGGFQGINKVIQTKNIDLTAQQSLNLTTSGQKKIGLTVNARNMWNNSPALSVTSDLQMAGAPAKTMADNFMSGWSLAYVQN